MGNFARRIRARLIATWSRGKIEFGRGAHVERGSFVIVRKSGRLTIGQECRIRAGAMLNVTTHHVRIGDHFSLNAFSVIYGTGPISIGNYVRIASNVVVIPQNHNFDDPDIPIHRQGTSRKGIVIEDDVWIGANVTVLDGAHLSQGCVVAAGSVVRGRTVPYGIYAGLPAKLIRRRGEERRPPGSE